VSSTKAPVKGVGDENIAQEESRSLVDKSEDESSPKVENSITHWGTNSHRTMYYEIGEVEKLITPGLYRCKASDRLGYYFSEIQVKTDDLLEIPETISEYLLAEITHFWSIQHKFRELGFLHKRGIMMFGDPGSGKTSAIQRLVQLVIKRGDIAVYADNPAVLSGCLQMLRTHEPDRSIVVILEDFDTLVGKSRDENEWLSVLDGETQVDNVVYLATTNYIQKIDKRFTDRPSRFDMVIAVDMPGATARACFLKCKYPSFSNDEIEKWVAKTDGFAYAHLKEMIVGVKLFERKFEQVLDHMTKMRAREFTNDDFKFNWGQKKKLGFETEENVPVEDRNVINWEVVHRVVTADAKSRKRGRPVVTVDDKVEEVTIPPVTTTGKKASRKSRANGAVN